MSRPSWKLAAVALLPVAVACNAILGNEEGHLVALGSDGGESCLLNSDCTPDVCLFKTCSVACKADVDCDPGFRCLKTKGTAGCVSSAQATCPEQECPEGTECNDGQCRTSCAGPDDTSSCGDDQVCSEGNVCTGTDPGHDPIAGGGTGGAGGMGGMGGMPGMGGSGGMDASAGSGGMMATGGADAGFGGRDASVGSGGMDGGLEAGLGQTDGGPGDGTVVATAGTSCSSNGDYACAGHAQKGQLVCTDGTWESLSPCSGSDNCDSTPGANAGTCQPIVAECSGQMAGDTFCRDGDVHECGVDLVTAPVVETCPYVCSDGSCSGECVPGDNDCAGGGGSGLVPRTCDADGLWQDESACSYLCQDSTCVAASCGDGSKNGDETDVDCGGSCGGCAVGDGCGKNADCALPASGKCTTGTCAKAGCGDGVKNGTETDVDCGGSCGGCAVGDSCGKNADCALPASGKCTGGKCAAPGCGDGVKNGTETDVDCGGGCAADCALGDGCGKNADCASSNCVTGTCEVPEDCSNGVDDDGDGNTDCADSECGAYQCLTVPSGWDGPIVITEGSTVPSSCPSIWNTKAVSGDSGKLSWQPVSCTQCACPSISCAGQPAMRTYSLYGDCSGSYNNFTLEANTCTPTYMSARVLSVPGPSSSSCGKATGGVVSSRPGATFSTNTVGCQLSSPNGGGCTANQVCAPATPPGFDSAKYCVHQTGDQACPGSYPIKKLVYDGYDDSRDCTKCSTCAMVGSCGRIFRYSTSACQGTHTTTTGTISCYQSIYDAIMWSPNIGCTSSGGSPTGNVTPASPTTICCNG